MFVCPASPNLCSPVLSWLQYTFPSLPILLHGQLLSHLPIPDGSVGGEAVVSCLYNKVQNLPDNEDKHRTKNHTSDIYQQEQPNERAAFSAHQ